LFNVFIFFFFFKQKTAYEMRISDWSSDVCSSDLAPSRPHPSRRSRRSGEAGSQKAGSWRRAAEGRGAASCHQIDQTIGDDNDFFRDSPRKHALHLLGRKRERLDIRLGRALGCNERIAKLAVDLNGDGDAVIDEQRRIGVMAKTTMSLASRLESAPVTATTREIGRANV